MNLPPQILRLDHGVGFIPGCAFARAEAYPAAQVRSCGFSARGGKDTTARLIGQTAERAARPLIIQKRPGAVGNIADSRQGRQGGLPMGMRCCCQLRAAINASIYESKLQLIATSASRRQSSPAKFWP